MGFTPASGLFTASEVGATHQRKRWFCVAYSGSPRLEGVSPDQRHAQGRDAQRIARYMLARPYTPQTGGALYYHNGTVSQRWASRMTITARIGGHVFYREKNNG